MSMFRKFLMVVAVLAAGTAKSVDHDVSLTGTNRPPDSAVYAGVAALDRTCFIRMEKGQGMELTVTNNRAEPISHVSLSVAMLDEQRRELDRRSLLLPVIAGRACGTVDYALDTSVRPGKYNVKVQVCGPDNAAYSREEEFPVTIVPRPLPLVMPVVMWNGYQYTNTVVLQQIKELGFTMGWCEPAVDFTKIWAAGTPTAAADPKLVARTKYALNFALANDYGVTAFIRSIQMRHFPLWRRDNYDFKYWAVDRSGKHYENGERVCGFYDEVQRYCYNVGVSLAQTYGHFPAFKAALIHSEVVGVRETPCFSEASKAAYRKASGKEIPADVSDSSLPDRSGMDYLAGKDCPADRVVPDDHPTLNFYRWFWRDPNYVITLHNQVHRGLKSTGRENFWTWNDPVLAHMGCYGLGGEMDVIADWLYSYEFGPLDFGRTADTLFALKKGGKPGQQVMVMTQIIWYRNQVAPEGLEVKVEGERWPYARFITIAPDHLREGFWSKMARPVAGDMYFGLASLIGPVGSDYAYTNPKTQEVLKDLTRTVVKPLGPMLLQVPDRQADVAMLVRFTSRIMLSKYPNDMCHQVLQYAQLQPEVVFEDTILRDGLDAFKVLVMPGCEILPASVVKKVKAFQMRGGIVVGDEHLCPAISADIVLRLRMPKWPNWTARGRAREDKAALQAQAVELRAQLDAVYEHPSDSSNPEVVTRLRRYGSTDYLFVVNDYRDYGDYVGQYQRVMEKGLPSRARVSVKRNGEYVYDLVKGQEVSCEAKGGRLEFDVALEPGGGGVYMVTDQKIGGVNVTMPKMAKIGESISCRVEVVDSAGKMMQGVVTPVRVQISDATGKDAEYSGYYGIKDGELTIRMDIARNELPGKWRLRVQELASGKMTEKTLKIRH